MTAQLRAKEISVVSDAITARKHMDSQDARIAELTATAELVPELEKLAKKRADRIAELEREIREARELFGLLEWSMALRVYYGNMRRFGIKMQGWLERNAERKNGQ